MFSYQSDELQMLAAVRIAVKEKVFKIMLPKKSDATRMRAQAYAFRARMTKATESEPQLYDVLGELNSVTFQIEDSPPALVILRKDSTPAQQALAAALERKGAVIEDPNALAIRESEERLIKKLAETEPDGPQATGRVTPYYKRDE